MPGHASGQFTRPAAARSALAFPALSRTRLANPEHAVVRSSSNGGSMYTIQALWTAAHHAHRCEIRHVQQPELQAAQLNVGQ